MASTEALLAAANCSGVANMVNLLSKKSKTLVCSTQFTDRGFNLNPKSFVALQHGLNYS
jgi:hypothetical protein